MSNLFKVPNKSGKSQTIYVIGVIDASGSMQGYWNWVADFWNQNIPKDHCTTITFDTKSRICATNILSHNLNEHGGGGTKIPEAFQTFEQQLALIPENSTVNAVFISDGEDNYINTVEQRCNNLLKGSLKHRINFMCLGIQSGFPTFLSMKLRQIYHTGDGNIPALYLIEYASEKAFFNKFESMKPYFTQCSLLDVTPPVRLYPWDNEKEEVYEGSWVLCDKDFIIVNDEKVPFEEEKVGIEEIVDVFRGWSQGLQLSSLNVKNKEETEKNARICEKEMEIILEKFRKRTGIDLKNSDNSTPTTSFHERVLRNLIKNVGVRAVWFLNEVQSIAKGVNPQSLNEYDAAKRIGIGTITGKYHQKALALKGITMQDFKQIAEEFKELFVKTKLNETEESKQEKSVITLQNQKEVFLDKDFLKGLDLCKSQYDLIEAFPVIGYAIKLKRFDGSMINPWLTQVRFIAKQHKSLDSTILVTNQMKLELPVLDKKEEINCVLPLFEESDKEMMPLINSRLYRLAMTFLVMQNVDFYYEEAYFALLANTFIFMFTFDKSEWRDEILHRIYVTVKLTYEHEASFKKYLADFVEKPIEAFYESNENNQRQHVDLSKPMFFLFFCFKEKLLSTEELEKRLAFILIDYVNEIFVSQKKKYHDFFSFGFEKEGVSKLLLEEKDKCYSLSEFVKLIPSTVKNSMKTGVKSIKLNKKLLYQEDEKVKLSYIEKLQKIVLGEDKTFTDQDYLRYIYHVENNLNKDDRFLKELESDSQKVKEKTLASLSANQTGKLAHYTQLVSDLKKSYIETFAQKHWEVRPFSNKELEELCQKHNISVNDLKFKPSKLFNNACNSPNCQFFMKIVDEKTLKKHLDGWAGRMPIGFHKFVGKNREMDGELIFEKLCKEKNFDINYYQVTKEFTLNYIEKVKSYYHQFTEEEYARIYENINKSDKILGEKKPAEKQNKPHNNARGRGRGRGGGYKKNMNRGGNRGARRGH